MNPESRQAVGVNVDSASVEHFGHEWATFSHEDGWADEAAFERVFEAYFSPLPDGALGPESVVADFGAGSGRWAAKVAPRVGSLVVVEPSMTAITVARNNLRNLENVSFIQEPIGGASIPSNTFDVGYSIGVLHCVPDPVRALSDIRETLKPGGWFLGYLYYALETRPTWYRALWKGSDFIRARVSGLPPRQKRWTTNCLAALVYYPTARAARIAKLLGGDAKNMPLGFYADKSYYVMRNDAMDRFGTPLEHRFTRREIESMLAAAGYDPSKITFSEGEPFWCFAAQKDSGE